MEGADRSGVLLDYAQDKVVLLDEQGVFTYVNRAAEHILGFEPAELVGENAFDYVHPGDIERVRGTFEETTGSDGFTEGTVTYRHRAADGSWVWLESRMSNLTDAALDGYVVSSRDITNRVEAEREREQTATRLREIAATSGDVLWMFDADWSEILFVNPAYEDIYGGSIEELERDSTSFLDAIHPADVPLVEDAMERLSAGEALEIEYRVNPGEDYDRWVWVQAQPVFEDGEVVRITGFSRDVTDRRRRERQLVVMDKLLRHNLRNDLNIVVGTAALIEDELPKAADRTAVIRSTAESLLATAEKERDIIDVLTDRTAPERVDAVDVAETSAATVRDRFPDATVTVSAPDEAFVHVLPQVSLAVTELIENALTHSDEATPEVLVLVQSDGERVDVAVEDDAPPIPDIEKAVLTGNHDMDDVYHSSGLGFWLVHWTVELSNGDIAVTTTDDGNRVTVSLPASDV